MLRFVLACVLALIVATPVRAIEPCDEGSQAKLLVLAVSQTTKIGGEKPGDITVGVLGGGSMIELIKKEAAGQKAKVAVRAVDPSTVAQVQVLYLPKGTSPETIAACRTSASSTKLLTAAGNPQDALDQSLSLSFHSSGEKPRVLINLTAAAAEGAEFAPQLLSIADRFRKD